MAARFAETGGDAIDDRTMDQHVHRRSRRPRRQGPPGPASPPRAPVRRTSSQRTRDRSTGPNGDHRPQLRRVRPLGSGHARYGSPLSARAFCARVVLERSEHEGSPDPERWSAAAVGSEVVRLAGRERWLGSLEALCFWRPAGPSHGPGGCLAGSRHRRCRWGVLWSAARVRAPVPRTRCV